eukprot:6071064-Lingulodinium_polyedra.AAC.1
MHRYPACADAEVTTLAAETYGRVGDSVVEYVETLAKRVAARDEDLCEPKANWERKWLVQLST